MVTTRLIPMAMEDCILFQCTVFSTEHRELLLLPSTSMASNQSTVMKLRGHTGETSLTHFHCHKWPRWHPSPKAAVSRSVIHAANQCLLQITVTQQGARTVGGQLVMEAPRTTGVVLTLIATHVGVAKPRTATNFQNSNATVMLTIRARELMLVT